MRLLVLGGTSFLGRTVVEQALERGDAVTIVHRGVTGRRLFDGQVERVLADREGGLGPLAGRAFDAVVDTSGYLPDVVAHALDVLGGGVDRYVFVSTGNVYADHSLPGTREDAPTIAFSDDLVDEARYGGGKAACEALVRSAFADRCLIARSGLIVGPHDPTGRFSWWVERIARGGRTLAPEPRTQRAQLIDVRDLAAFLLAGADGRVQGTFNVTGPEGEIDLETVLEAIRGELSPASELVWIAESELIAAGVEPWSELPLWIAPGTDPSFAAFLAMDTSRALAAGLALRPLGETVRDLHAWLGAGNPLVSEGRAAVGLSAVREAELLAASAG